MRSGGARHDDRCGNRRLLASGSQQGEPNDQTQIMRTPHLMDEPLYSSRPAAAFSATLELTRPTLVEITAEGPWPILTRCNGRAPPCC